MTYCSKACGDRLFTNTSLILCETHRQGREQIDNKSFVKMIEKLGYDVELTYNKKAAD